MKILKPGKVELRKFVCPKCGCVFVACKGENVIRQSGSYETAVIACPEQGCNGGIVVWSDGESYEEPVEDDRERLMALLEETPDVMIWPDAQRKITDYLIANGVTFREG